jgi:hypothetical protein
MVEPQSIQPAGSSVPSSDSSDKIRKIKQKLEVEFRQDWEQTEKENSEASGAVEAALRFIVR